MARTLTIEDQTESSEIGWLMKVTIKEDEDHLKQEHFDDPALVEKQVREFLRVPAKKEVHMSERKVVKTDGVKWTLEEFKAMECGRWTEIDPEFNDRDDNYACVTPTNRWLEKRWPETEWSNGPRYEWGIHMVDNERIGDLVANINVRERPEGEAEKLTQDEQLHLLCSLWVRYTIDCGYTV